ncbi:Bug family tripartite tricarboxylate transporter substrate binding protein [Siccirubricoccus phaeus]|uniref:Bug family tripartite tricarboxylate transporter substrate binding protein n=1 Tax=Siccirubricoccus phaeus TaxID=2595053 RepID=UPI00165C07A6|nr:tripartite tricarboxylate transporter substrate-binding protein [Siccirubricoccus phaeus]
MMRSLLLAAWAALALLLQSAPGFAAWPERPVRLIVTYPPGGNTDTLARLTAEILSEAYGVQVIVDNRGGAGGYIAMEAAARAAPDGYTLLFASVANVAIAPAVMRNHPPVDTVADLTPISLVATNPLIMAVSRSLSVKTIPELIARFKAEDGGMPYASGGVGSVQHLATELFLSRAGTGGTHIPFRGGPAAMAEVVAGRIPVLFSNPADVVAFNRSPDVLLIGASGRHRLPELPEVPTIAEAGLPGFELETWNGLFGPAGLPAEVVQRAAEALARRRGDPVVASRFARTSTQYVAMDTPAFTRLVRDEVPRWAELARQAKAQQD